MAYFTLVTLEAGVWAPQFGDFVKRVVKDEARDSYAGLPRKIIRTDTAHQFEIDRAIAKLNGEFSS